MSAREIHVINDSPAGREITAVERHNPVATIREAHGAGHQQICHQAIGGLVGGIPAAASQPAAHLKRAGHVLTSEPAEHVSDQASAGKAAPELRGGIKEHPLPDVARDGGQFPHYGIPTDVVSGPDDAHADDVHLLADRTEVRHHSAAVGVEGVKDGQCGAVG